MLNEYIKSKIVLEKMNYVFLDEVQFVDGFAKLNPSPDLRIDREILEHKTVQMLAN